MQELKVKVENEMIRERGRHPERRGLRMISVKYKVKYTTMNMSGVVSATGKCEVLWEGIDAINIFFQVLVQIEISYKNDSVSAGKMW